MCGTSYAKSLKSHSQGPASAIDANCHVVRGDAQALRDLGTWLTQQVNAADNLCVLWWQGRQEPVKTRANSTIGFIVGHRKLFPYLQTLLSPLFDSRFPIVVCQRAAQHAGKPASQRTTVSDGLDVLHNFQVEVLEDVFRFFPTGRTPDKEP